MENSLKSGDFLEDIDIEIVIRSGKTDFKVLQNLTQAIVASVVELADSDLVLTETEDKILYKYQKKLITLKRILQL